MPREAVEFPLEVSKKGLDRGVTGMPWEQRTSLLGQGTTPDDP